jgi:uncharacterized protein YdeI (YjbR/CyaY-like superfamily)
MSTVSQRIDLAYAKHTGEIGRLLSAIRKAIHESKTGLEETWKWGPGFEKDGKLLIGLWGFKKHVSLVLYQGAHIKDKHKQINDGFDNAHNRMVKFTEYKQFNKKKIIDLVKEVVKLHESGGQKEGKSEMKIPAELIKFFSRNKSAEKFFNELSHTYKREYVQLINGAKTEATREKRVVKVTQALKEKKKSLT